MHRPPRAGHGLATTPGVGPDLRRRTLSRGCIQAGVWQRRNVGLGSVAAHRDPEVDDHGRHAPLPARCSRQCGDRSRDGTDHRAPPALSRDPIEDGSCAHYLPTHPRPGDVYRGHPDCSSGAPRSTARGSGLGTLGLAFGQTHPGRFAARRWSCPIGNSLSWPWLVSMRQRSQALSRDDSRGRTLDSRESGWLSRTSSTTSRTGSRDTSRRSSRRRPGPSAACANAPSLTPAPTGPRLSPLSVSPCRSTPDPRAKHRGEIEELRERISLYGEPKRDSLSPKRDRGAPAGSVGAPRSGVQVPL